MSKKAAPDSRGKKGRISFSTMHDFHSPDPPPIASDQKGPASFSSPPQRRLLIFCCVVSQPILIWFDLLCSCSSIDPPCVQMQSVIVK
jgi:hypothetical protein